MAKKKINPEDLQLNEEIVSGKGLTKNDGTYNTCGSDEPYPYTCDTTTTQPTFNGCTTLEEDKCDQSLIECPTVDCASKLCNNTQSAEIICCDTIKNCKDTNICQVYPSIDVCLETENNCMETIACVIISSPCIDTDTCEIPITRETACDDIISDL